MKDKCRRIESARRLSVCLSILIVSISFKMLLCRASLRKLLPIKKPDKLTDTQTLLRVWLKDLCFTPKDKCQVKSILEDHVWKGAATLKEVVPRQTCVTDKKTSDVRGRVVQYTVSQEASLALRRQRRRTINRRVIQQKNLHRSQWTVCRCSTEMRCAAIIIFNLKVRLE